MPDFFIVGAPKCGTTAVASYLGAHPEILMAPVKEPNYLIGRLGEQVSRFRSWVLCPYPSSAYRETLCVLEVALDHRGTFPTADKVRELQAQACLAEHSRRTSEETPT